MSKKLQLPRREEIEPNADGADVQFDETLEDSENLEQIMRILRDHYEVELEEVHMAAAKVFGEDDPDPLYAGFKEEFESSEEGALAGGWNTIPETVEKMNQL